jgi:hypothetical protein
MQVSLFPVKNGGSTFELRGTPPIGRAFPGKMACAASSHGIHLEPAEALASVINEMHAKTADKKAKHKPKLWPLQAIRKVGT